MLFYSHLWDLALKIVSLAATMVLLVGLHAEQRLAAWGVPGGASAFVVVAIGAVVWVLVYRQALSTIATWLYARVNLGAGLSLAEARRLAKLTQLDLSLKWIPLAEVRRLPRAERREALLIALTALGPHRKAMLL